MRRLALLTSGIMALLLATFLAVEALGVPLLVDPTPWMAGGGAAAALLAFGLLTFDVFLPVPSSIVMVLDGALFGFALGLALNLGGALAATLLAYALGRRGGPLLHRLMPPDERARAQRLFDRWGDLALLLTRPVPILAETAALLAGATRMRPARLVAFTLLGALPAAALYALAGASGYGFSIALFLGLMLLAAGAWWLARRLFPAPDGAPQEAPAAEAP